MRNTTCYTYGHHAIRDCLAREVGPTHDWQYGSRKSRDITGQAREEEGESPRSTEARMIR